MKLQTAHKLFLLGLAILALGLSPILFPGAFNAGGQQQNFGVPGGSSGQVQYNSSGSLAGASGLTTDGTTVGFNGNAAITSAPPFAATATLGWKFCTNGTTLCQGVATSTEIHKTTWLSIVTGIAANNATATTPDGNAFASIGTYGVFGATYNTNTNCSSSAAPAVCASAASGSVVVAAAATTVQVNTTAVTANSQIQLTFDSSLGTKLSVTCNTTPVQPTVSARVAATSFTITVPSAPATNPACFSYSIIN